MSAFHEQWICVKFHLKLGKSFSETFEMLKITFKDEACGPHSNIQMVETLFVCTLWQHSDFSPLASQYNGENISKRAELFLMMICTWDSYQCWKMPKYLKRLWSHLFKSLFECLWDIRKSISWKQCAVKFLQKIWACISLQPNLLYACWRMI